MYKAASLLATSLCKRAEYDRAQYSQYTLHPALWWAMRWKEASNNPSVKDGDHGTAWGIGQQRPIFLKDVNRILEESGKDKRYARLDARDPVKAREMAEIYLNYYGNAFKKRFGIQPTDAQLGMMYNKGYASFVNAYRKDKNYMSPYGTFINNKMKEYTEAADIHNGYPAGTVKGAPVTPAGVVMPRTAVKPAVRRQPVQRPVQRPVQQQTDISNTQGYKYPGQQKPFKRFDTVTIGKGKSLWDYRKSLKGATWNDKMKAVGALNPGKNLNKLKEGDVLKTWGYYN